MPFLDTNLVNTFLQKFGQNKDEYDIFIESGTYCGGTTISLIPSFKTLHTIELSEKYFNFFDQIKKDNNYSSVINHFGSTEEILPNILCDLEKDDKVVFWLDGHWSSNDTARGKKRLFVN